MADVDLLEIKPEEICQTQRYAELCKLTAYLDGCQYNGKPDFWTGENGKGEIVPLRERAPCVVYPLPRAAVNQAVRFTFGEGRFPNIKCEEVEAHQAVAPGLTLSAEEAEQVSSFVSELVEAGHLKSAMRMLQRRGCAARTGVAVLSFQHGKPCIDMPHAKDCWPTFVDGAVGGDVAQMVWCYQFQKLIRNKAGKLEYKAHYFRRDFTADAIDVYRDAPIEPNQDVKWVLERRDVHGLGFCPVKWIRNLPEEHGGDIDGRSLYDGLEDEFDALNFALSQRHRGLAFFGTPQPWETGVEQGDGPGQPARTAMPQAAVPAGWKGEGGGWSGEGAQMGPFGVNPKGPSRAARPTGPDNMWSYRGDTVKIGLLETTGKAFEVATGHVIDIRSRLLEAMDVILLDPTTVAGKGDLSAKALALMYAPLLALVDELRDCWWDFGLGAILGMFLRMVAKLGGQGVLVPGAEQVAKILARFEVQLDGETLWMPPKLTPVWGDYFSPSNEEMQMGVLTAVGAKDAGLVTKESAARFVAGYFGVEDVDEELEEQAAQAEEQMVQQADQMGAEAKAVADAQPPEAKPGKPIGK